MKTQSPGALLKALLIGRARDLSDSNLFHNLSLAALLAWVGLGADGLSSSCYGPEETFKTLGTHAVFALQRLFCHRGIPFVIVPARV